MPKLMNNIMTVQEAADYLRIHRMTVYRHLVKGKVPGVKVGGQWRVRKELLDIWLLDTKGRYRRNWSAT